MSLDPENLQTMAARFDCIFWIDSRRPHLPWPAFEVSPCLPAGFLSPSYHTLRL